MTSVLSQEQLEALLEQGQQDAARQDEAKKKSTFNNDYEKIDVDDPPFPKYGYEKDSKKSRPRSRRSDDDDIHERGSGYGSDHSRRYDRGGRPPRERNSYGRDDRYRHRSRSPRDGPSPRDRDARRGSDEYERRHRLGGNGNDKYRARSPLGNGRSPRNGGRDDRNRYEASGRGGRRDPQPEPVTSDSDSRTVFVQQLANRLRTRELEGFFSKVGEVVEATIVKDRVSGRSKGVGYVEFKKEESVKDALNLTGQKLLGIPIIVQLTEAEKNRQARATDSTPTVSNGIPFHRLYVGNIHFNIEEDDLQGIFGTYGDIDFIQLNKDDNDRSKGFGFVQFHKADDAKSALAELNGFEIAGRPIRVGLGNDKMNQESQNMIAQRFQESNRSNFEGSSFSGSGGRGAHAGGATNFESQNRREDKAATNSGALDDSDVGGVNFNNFSRDSLMKKLARIEDPAPADQAKGGKAASSKKPTTASFVPSRCIVIKNAYDEAEETEPDWEKELEMDVREECSNQYGEVVHCGIPSERSEGAIYVKFKDVKGGDNALKGLNGRLFGGKHLTAKPVVDAIYNTNFPKAAAL